MVVEHSVTEVVLFCVLIIVCLWCDLHAHQADKPVSARNAAIWSCIWVGLALVFAGYIGYSFGSEQVQLFLTGYLLEKSLSVDNLFVIMAIFSSFAVKDAFQHRVLYYGVLGALVLRLISGEMCTMPTTSRSIFTPMYARMITTDFSRWRR